MHVRFAFARLAACATLASAADQAHLERPRFEGDRRPRLSLSPLSAYGMAADFDRAVDLGFALERPVSDRNSALLGIRHKTFMPASASDGDGFSRSSWGVEAAFRRHPWDWMPGFFFQALFALEAGRAENLAYDPVPRGYQHALSAFSELDETVLRVDRRAYEGGLGYGYVWSLGRVAVELQGIFGPIGREDTAHARWTRYDGATGQARQRTGWTGELIRFRDLRVGLVF
jgi:hypothetical protein